MVRWQPHLVWKPSSLDKPALTEPFCWCELPLIKPWWSKRNLEATLLATIRWPVRKEIGSSWCEHITTLLALRFSVAQVAVFPVADLWSANHRFRVFDGRSLDCFRGINCTIVGINGVIFSCKSWSKHQLFTHSSWPMCWMGNGPEFGKAVVSVGQPTRSLQKACVKCPLLLLCESLDWRLTLA